jgi:hypothetical protein
MAGTRRTSESLSSMPSFCAAWSLTSAQLGGPPLAPFQHAAGGDWLAVDEGVFPQEDLMRRVRGVDLIEIDPGRRLVGDARERRRQCPAHCRVRAFCARVRTMKFVAAAGDVERIVGLQRNVDGAAASLADEIEAMVEELAKQGEEAVERRGVAEIRRHVFGITTVSPSIVMPSVSCSMS